MFRVFYDNISDYDFKEHNVHSENRLTITDNFVGEIVCI